MCIISLLITCDRCSSSLIQYFMFDIQMRRKESKWAERHSKWRCAELFDEYKNDVNHMLSHVWVTRSQPNWTPMGDFGVTCWMCHQNTKRLQNSKYYLTVHIKRTLGREKNQTKNTKSRSLRRFCWKNIIRYFVTPKLKFILHKGALMLEADW